MWQFLSFLILQEDYEEDFDEVLEDSSTDDHPPSDEEKTTVPTSELNDIMQVGVVHDAIV